MRVYRIAAESVAKTANDAFSGNGGLHGMGRWHTTGRRVVYCASHLSLAALEALVHIQRANRIQPYVHYEADIPDGLSMDAAGLPVDWKTNILFTQTYGDQWLKSKATVLLRVPSVIVDSEFNFLLNPEHQDFNLAWIVRGPIPFAFDPRLTKP